MTVIGNAPDALGPHTSEPTPKFDNALLNPFSASFAAYLFQKYPEWRQFASSEGDVLSVAIPSLVPGRSLWITTYNDEVTIALSPGMWHEHFNAGTLECTNEESFASALEWIDGIIAEELLIAETRREDGETRSWTTVRRDQKITSPQRGRKIVLMSWRGTYDREIPSGWLGWLRGLGR